MEQTYSILLERKKQLEALLSIVKEDLTSGEVLSREEELKAILETNDELEDVDIKCIENLTHFVYGSWLFEYKGRGYVLLDQSNGHYSYFCTAEDFFYDLGLSVSFYQIRNL